MVKGKWSAIPIRFDGCGHIGDIRSIDDIPTLQFMKEGVCPICAAERMDKRERERNDPRVD